MKRKIIICSFFLMLFALFSHIVLAKYVIEESIIAATIQVDRTPPSLQVTYSTKEVTSGKVEVTIKAKEEMQEVEGWTLSKDKKTLKKEYTQNTQEEVKVKDIAGNVTKTSIRVNNIDKEAPVITVRKITNNSTYPNYANKDSILTISFTIQDNRKIVNLLEEKDIKLLIGKKEITPKKKQITIEKNTDIEKKVLLTITGIEEEGNLILQIPSGIIKDEAENSNSLMTKDTKIQIDNIKPEATFSEKQIEEGNVTKH